MLRRREPKPCDPFILWCTAGALAAEYTGTCRLTSPQVLVKFHTIAKGEAQGTAVQCPLCHTAFGLCAPVHVYAPVPLEHNSHWTSGCYALCHTVHIHPHTVCVWSPSSLYSQVDCSVYPHSSISKCSGVDTSVHRSTDNPNQPAPVIEIPCVLAKRGARKNHTVARRSHKGTFTDHNGPP